MQNAATQARHPPLHDTQATQQHWTVIGSSTRLMLSTLLVTRPDQLGAARGAGRPAAQSRHSHCTTVSHYQQPSVTGSRVLIRMRPIEGDSCWLAAAVRHAAGGFHLQHWHTSTWWFRGDDIEQLQPAPAGDFRTCPCKQDPVASSV